MLILPLPIVLSLPLNGVMHVKSHFARITGRAIICEKRGAHD
jgi:hypothetical protein